MCLRVLCPPEHNHNHYCHDDLGTHGAICGAQQYRALMMILQYHKTVSMISMMLSHCPISCAFETCQVLSPVLFQQPLYFPFQFTEFLFTCVCSFLHALPYYYEKSCKACTNHCISRAIMYAILCC